MALQPIRMQGSTVLEEKARTMKMKQTNSTSKAKTKPTFKIHKDAWCQDEVDRKEFLFSKTLQHTFLTFLYKTNTGLERGGKIKTEDIKYAAYRTNHFHAIFPAITLDEALEAWDEITEDWENWNGHMEHALHDGWTKDELDLAQPKDEHVGDCEKAHCKYGKNVFPVNRTILRKLLGEYSVTPGAHVKKWLEATNVNHSFAEMARGVVGWRPIRWLEKDQAFVDIRSNTRNDDSQKQIHAPDSGLGDEWSIITTIKMDLYWMTDGPTQRSPITSIMRLVDLVLEMEEVQAWPESMRRKITLALCQDPGTKLFDWVDAPLKDRWPMLLEWIPELLRKSETPDSWPNQCAADFRWIWELRTKVLKAGIKTEGLKEVHKLYVEISKQKERGRRCRGRVEQALMSQMNRTLMEWDAKWDDLVLGSRRHRACFE